MAKIAGGCLYGAVRYCTGVPRSSLGENLRRESKNSAQTKPIVSENSSQMSVNARIGMLETYD